MDKTIIGQVVLVIKKYHDMHMKLSLRQIYYQLVAHYNLDNTLSNYKQLSKHLVKARKDGLIEYDDIEDRTRNFTTTYLEDTIIVRSDVEGLVNYVKYHEEAYSDSTFQPHLHIISVEKQALEGFFKSIIKKYNTMLIINRGFNSLTQLHEIADYISHFKNLTGIYISYFGDYDPSGFEIERNFVKQLKEQLIEFGIDIEVKNERIALTEPQISQYKLPTAIPKATDSRTKNFQDNKAVELDSLDPDILKKMVNDEQTKYFDIDVYKALSKLNKRVDNRYQKYLKRRMNEEYGDEN